MNSRSLLIAGALLVLLGILGLVFLPQSPWSITHSSPSSSSAPEKPMSPAELKAAWQANVSSALATYDQDQDATRAKTSLLASKVPGEDKDIHLELIIAFEAVAQNQPGAPARLTKARADYEAVSSP